VVLSFWRQAAGNSVEACFDTEPDLAGEHFEIPLALIRAYEAQHRPVDPTDSIKASDAA